MRSDARTLPFGIATAVDPHRPSPFWQVWLLGFIYTLLAGGVIQIVLLPTLFPAWVTAGGLLKSTDSVGYHNMAMAVAHDIQAKGWSAWQLAPKSQFTVGFTALFYALLTPEPWVMLPVKAAAHALCFAILYHVLSRFLSDWRLALLCACPYLLFPSSALWYSQLLKDGYFNAGLMLFVLGWVKLASLQTWSGAGPDAQFRGRLKIAAWIGLILLGYLIMSLVRVYMFAVLVFLCWLLAIVVAGVVLPAVRRHAVSMRATLLAAAALAAVLSGTVVIRQSLIGIGYISADNVNVEDRYNRLTTDPARAQSQPYWARTTWLPKALDKRFAVLAGVRDGYVTSSKVAKSMIDRDVTFQQVADIFAYLPRALEIGLLAPFPDMWLGQGSTGATTVMRRVSMLEMSATYIALLFLPFAIWHWRNRGEMWVMLTASLSIIVLYAVTTPNIGTLYRVRYGYLMMLICLGLAGACTLWTRSAKRNASNEIVGGG